MNTVFNFGRVISNRVARNSKHRTFRRATNDIYGSFTQQYPEWAASFFDKYFLTYHAIPFLVNSWQDDAVPHPVELANIWAAQLTWSNMETRQRLVTELTPVASDFLRLLTAELRTQETVRRLITRAA